MFVNKCSIKIKLFQEEYEIGGVFVATSSFSKYIELHPKKIVVFMKEMTKPVTPTLSKNFQSQSVNLAQDSILKERVKKVLTK